jgi:hypothetical protein
MCVVCRSYLATAGAFTVIFYGLTFVFARVKRAIVHQLLQHGICQISQALRSAVALLIGTTADDKEGC